METSKMREDYGWGWNEECSVPEIGDVLSSKKQKTVYTVIAIDGKRLVTHCVWIDHNGTGTNSSIVFIEPLPDVGYFTDFILIGNILGAIKNTKDHFREYRKSDPNKYLADTV